MRRPIVVSLLLVGACAIAISTVLWLRSPARSWPRGTRSFGIGVPIQWSPDGRFLLCLDLRTSADDPRSGPSLDIIDTQTGTRRRFLDGRGTARRAASLDLDMLNTVQWYSPDALAYVEAKAGRRVLVKVELRSLTKSRVAELPSDTVPQSVLIGPSGRVLFMRRSKGPDRNLWMVKLTGGEAKRVTDYGVGGGLGVVAYPFRNYQWSADGESVAYEEEQLGVSTPVVFGRHPDASRGVRQVDLGSGTSVAVKCASEERAVWLDWAKGPRGRCVYGRRLAGTDVDLMLRDCTTGRSMRLARSHSLLPAAVLSRDASRVAFTSGDSFVEPKLAVLKLP